MDQRDRSRVLDLYRREVVGSIPELNPFQGQLLDGLERVLAEYESREEAVPPALYPLLFEEGDITFKNGTYTIAGQITGSVRSAVVLIYLLGHVGEPVRTHKIRHLTGWLHPETELERMRTQLDHSAYFRLVRIEDSGLAPVYRLDRVKNSQPLLDIRSIFREQRGQIDDIYFGLQEKEMYYFIGSVESPVNGTVLSPSGRALLFLLNHPQQKMLQEQLEVIIGRKNISPAMHHLGEQLRHSRYYRLEMVRAKPMEYYLVKMEPRGEKRK